jgi:hypothetical protein
MCFLLAFSPAYVHASAAPLLDFAGVANGAKVAGGYIADYWFKRSANDPNYNAANDDYYETKKHFVSNTQMGDTWRERWSGKLGSLGAGLAATTAIAGMLAAADWILDPRNNTIQKRIVDTNFLYCTVSSQACRSTFQEYAQSVIDNDMSGSVRWKNPRSIKLLSPTSFTDEYVGIFTFSYVIDVYDFRNGQEYYKNSPEIVRQGRRTKETTEYFKQATPADIAEQVANATPKVQEQLATPAAKDEKHEPTAAAAAAASPTAAKSPPKPEAPKDNSNKCSAGQSVDADGKCKSNAPPKCPAGQVLDPVKKKCFAPKPDDDDPEPEGEDWPEFCEWASPVCNFIEWAKQDVPNFDAENVDVEDTAADAESITSQILTLGYVSGGVKTCPSNEDLSFEFMGQSIGFEISYAPLCEMLLTARPVVIAIAYFQAAKIVFVGRRD